MAREVMDDSVDKEQQKKMKTKPPFVKWVIIGLGVLLLIGGVASAAYFYINVYLQPKKAAVQPVIGTVWPMEPFIVNLQDTNGDRYLKLVLQLEVSDPEGVKELNLLKPKLRDNILDLLSAKTYRELMDVTGKQRLKEEITLRINSFLTTTKVSRVYFTEFIVQ
ncbi:MAG: flagellar basal body-associated FliL family protein [Syntrophales bacterium]|nr:flagellar basal body-associated FliL family protein [Syntrophales bacterium]